MADPNRKLTVAIVGGGIVGLSLAVYLHKLGKVDLHIYESAPVFSEIGAGIGIGHNASNAYREMGLYDECYRLSLGDRASLRNVFFDMRFSESKYKDPFICTVYTPAVTIGLHRADLLDVLVRNVPKDNVYFGKHLTRYEQTESGVTMYFADGTSATSDVLIGADGIKSKVRYNMYAEQGKAEEMDPKWSGTIAYRGLIPTDKVLPLLGERATGTSALWMGNSKHIIQFPIAGGKIINIVAFVSNYKEGRYPTWKGSAWVQDVPQQEMLDDFAEWTEPLKDMLKLIEKPSRWAVFELPQLPYFVDRRVALMGDAAHAMTPHQGNGASQGIEDAYILANMLSHPATNPSTVTHALKAYEHIRKPRVQRVQQTSYEAGMLWDLSGAEGDDPEKITENASTRMKWIWETDLKEGLAKATQFLEESIKGST